MDNTEQQLRRRSALVARTVLAARRRFSEDHETPVSIALPLFVVGLGVLSFVMASMVPQ